ncbi:unnamed protein product [Lathyrus oleraceus]
MEASFENLAVQLGLVSSQLSLKLSSIIEFDGKILDSPRDKEIEREFKQECEIIDEGGIEKENEKEKCTPSDKEIESRIEEVEVKIIYGKRTRMQYEDYIVLDEAPNVIICLDVDVQLQDLQKKNSPTPSNKADKRGEIDKVLDEIYALFKTIKLKIIWKKNLQFLKMMEFLPNKRKKKDDVFFLSYIPP